jgi:hypothetical protein
MSEVSTIFKVWGRQQGWVALPRKLRPKDSEKGPKNHDGKWEEKGSMFQWPEQKNEIVAWIKDSAAKQYDLYWCPCVFNQPRRVKENIFKMNILYADLDEKNPEKLPVNLRPSVAWESSPGRYAAIWTLDTEMDAKEAEKLNKNLTYYIGADRGGWDLTQVLRVPGLRNYKYEGAPKGKLLWHDEQPIPAYRFTQLPDVGMDDLQEMEVEEDMLVSEPYLLPNLVRPYLSKLNTKTLELLFTSEDEVLLEDRSERLWELECKLLESGVPKEDVVKLVAASAWNKYKGRKDETRRIVTEVNKAAATVDVPMANHDRMAKHWTSYGDLLGQNLADPGWMIEGVWQKTSHGMIAGEPKTYKSVIASDMMVSVASGTHFLNKYPVRHQGPVMCIQEENSPWLVQDRMLKIASSRGLLDGKVDTSKWPIITITWPQILPIHFLNNQGFDFTNEEDREFLEEAIREIKPVLIVFDPLYLMLGGRDENSAKDLRPVLNWLLHLRYDYKTSVIILHHWNKNGKSERGGQRMLGSVLFHGWVESAMYTSVINELDHEISIDREFRSFAKPNKIDVKFRFGEPGEYTYEPVIGDFVQNDDDAVYGLISSYGCVSEDEIKEALSLSKKQVKERLKALVQAGKVFLDGGLYRAKKESEVQNEEEQE